MDPCGSTLVEDVLHVFRTFAGHPRPRQVALDHPVITDSIQIDFASGRGPLADLVLSMTRRPTVMWQFARHRDAKTRAVVAFNCNVPGDLAEELASDPHPGVRRNAVYAPSLSTRTRVRMARQDPDPSVRREAWSSLTTSQGRSVTEGNRCAHAADTGEVWAIRIPFS